MFSQNILTNPTISEISFYDVITLVLYYREIKKLESKLLFEWGKGSEIWSELLGWLKEIQTVHSSDFERESKRTACNIY